MKGDIGFFVFLLAGPFCILFTVIALLTFGAPRWLQPDSPFADLMAVASPDSAPSAEGAPEVQAARANGAAAAIRIADFFIYFSFVLP